MFPCWSNHAFPSLHRVGPAGLIFQRFGYVQTLYRSVQIGHSKMLPTYYELVKFQIPFRNETEARGHFQARRQNRVGRAAPLASE